jgi:glycosyltransferase involved in cell wall biosynthesis
MISATGRPLRFCLLTTFYPPFNFGGDGIDVQRTARALVARGHQVTVVHDVDAYEWLAHTRLSPAPEHQDGVEVIGLRSRLRLLSPLLTHQAGWPVVHGRTIDRLMRERQFDVVVFNNVSLIGGPGLLAVGGDALKIYIAHEHWLVCPTHVLWRFNREPCDARACTRCVLSYRRPLQFWRYTGALERRLSEVDLFIARSEFSRRKHMEFGFSRPMTVWPHFMPEVTPEPLSPPHITSPKSRPYFLYVGRLVRMKGLDSVIAAFRRYRNADLLIVGEGEEDETLRRHAVDLPHVKFLGRIDNEHLDPYYQHAIAMIAPSIGYETFGIVVIEAFRQGTPVIARNQGSFPEIIEQSGGGLLFATEDDLIAAMTCLQQMPEQRDELSRAATRACRERWSEEIVVARFLELVRAGLSAT